MRRRIIDATPLISLFIFLLLGFIGKERGDNCWKIAWLVFLLIPLMPVLLGVKKLVITYPLIVIVAYILMGVFWPKYGWHPGWIIFITIPIVNILFPGKK